MARERPLEGSQGTLEENKRQIPMVHIEEPLKVLELGAVHSR